MRTEYSDKYITMGLKIDITAKRQALHKKFQPKESVRALIFCRKQKVQEQSEEYPWKPYSKQQTFLVSLPQSCWKMIDCYRQL